MVTDVLTTFEEAIFGVKLLKMASTQLVETSDVNSIPSQDSNHPDDLFQSRYFLKLLFLKITIPYHCKY